MKPSEISPLSANIIAEVMDAAKVPKGVFNMVHGLGPVVGEALSNHKDVDMMSFTGSTRGGGRCCSGCSKIGQKSKSGTLEENHQISFLMMKSLSNRSLLVCKKLWRILDSLVMRQLE